MAAVVSILRSTRRFAACGISVVTARNGTSAILGPMPIRSEQERVDDEGRVQRFEFSSRLRPAGLEIRADTGGGWPPAAASNLRVMRPARRRSRVR